MIPYTCLSLIYLRMIISVFIHANGTILFLLMTLDNYNGVITQVEPDILQCKVKWALGSIITNKASGGDGIPPELFKS